MEAAPRVASEGSATIRIIEGDPPRTMPNPQSLTIVVVAKNEERNIAECIASASFADEVLVLDSRSTDATARLAREAGARVVETDWPGAVGAFLVSAAVAAGEFMIGWRHFEFGIVVLPYVLPILVFVILLMFGMRRSA